MPHIMPRLLKLGEVRTDAHGMSVTGDDTATLPTLPTSTPAPGGGVFAAPVAGEHTPAPLIPPPAHSPSGMPSLPLHPATPDTSEESSVPATPASSTLTLDGELPRLGTSPTATPEPPAPPAPAPETAAATPAPAAPAPTEPDGDDTDVAEPAHPMAHLMPERSKPSEASRRAAELRAAKKAKSRKIKVAVAVGLITVAAIVGPIVARWVAGGLDDAGKTSTEQPAG
jgi:hypothetical protein